MKDRLCAKIFEEVYGYECLEFYQGIILYQIVENKMILHEMYLENKGELKEVFNQINRVAIANKVKELHGAVNQEKMPWLIAYYMKHGARIERISGPLVCLSVQVKHGGF